MPQQLQQFTQRPKSPLPVSVQVQQQQPMFPPGVKVPQVEQQPVGASISTVTPQNIGAQRPASAAQSVPIQQQRAPAAFPGSLSDLVVSFENVKQKGWTELLGFTCVYFLTEVWII